MVRREPGVASSNTVPGRTCTIDGVAINREPGRDTRAQQSAEREDQMRDRFGLSPGGEGRPGVDALLPLGSGVDVPFEVKSSDGDSVSTARDVGREHILKWRNRHWLFGFYERGSRNPPVARSYIYASPAQLEPWIAEQEQYVLPDWELVRLMPAAADAMLVKAVVGDKEHYSLRDAQKVLKQQKLEAGEHMTPDMRAVLADAGVGEPRKMTTPVYRAIMDRRAGFSALALEALIAQLADLLHEADLREALGDAKDFYPLEEVAAAVKGRRLEDGRKLTVKVLGSLCDRAEGFSPGRMLVLLRERARYLLDRGATRNNPHIPERRLLELVPADQVMPGDASRRSQRLEELVRRELDKSAAAIDEATA